jgi:transcription antitermination factor NusG
MTFKSDWHVLRCEYGSEVNLATVCAEIEGVRTYCPRYRVAWTRRDRRIERLVPFIATYLFVNFDGTDPYLWHQLRDTTGALGFLGGADPWVVPQVEIDRLRSCVGDDGYLSEEFRELFLRFKVGAELKLIAGPFSGMSGVCDTVDDDELEVGIKLTLLGREVVIYTPAAWCDPGDSTGRTHHHHPGLGAGTKRRKRRRRAKQPSASMHA